MNQQGSFEGAGHSLSLPMESDFMDLCCEEMESGKLGHPGFSKQLCCQLYLHWASWSEIIHLSLIK